MKHLDSFLPSSVLKLRGVIVIAVLAACVTQPRCLARDLTAPTNQPPTISTISDYVACLGQCLNGLKFNVDDTDTAPELLTVKAYSSNQQLVPNSNLFPGGTGRNRTLSVFPIANQCGETALSVVVTDSDGASSGTQFKFTVPCQTNHPPTISPIANLCLLPSHEISGVTFRVSDLETPSGLLTVAANSSSSQLVPDQNLLLGGGGTNRTLSIFPWLGRRGQSAITVTVTDSEGAAASTSFNLTVGECFDPIVDNVGDFNGDRLPDILFQHSDGSLGVWFMNKSEELVSASFFNPTGLADPRWKIAATADLNDDHYPDLIFQHADGTVGAWLMYGINLVTATLLSPSDPGPGWRVVGAGDVNRDNHDDILFQHDDGTLAVWLMNGTNLVYAAYLNPTRPADPRWRVVGTGKFTQVGEVDLVFQHEDGTLAVWLMNGVDLVQGELLNPATPSDKNWRVVGTVDLNKDGKTDLLFQHTDGSVGVWFMDGNNLDRATLLNPSQPGPGWRIAGPK
ncbi:MAG: hypothetical protein HY043_06435 [Verrucomicrobia bacterium]|nr:hypothetical protein [Verrucomicrobiota bacterium]